MATLSIEQGLLRGGKSTTNNGFEYFEFLGIPYAKPPVGDLRFKSPQPAEKWDGERDATISSKENTALQMDLIESSGIGGSEDCLYLNVYTPKITENESELLPVMFFIHGGGFVHGNGILKKDNGPDYLIEHNTVIVVINYRVSILGFLSLDIPEVAGNMGLKDQVKALEWVQNNIIHFGGDKNNVTIFGTSAGAASVDYLIVSPKAKGLFHKAILHSGSCLNHWAVNYEPKKLAYKVAEKLGYKGSLEDVNALKEFLLSIPGSDLTETAYNICQTCTDKHLLFGFVPTIEKDFGNGEAFLTDHPYRLLKEGIFNQVPVIKGFCNKEGYLMNAVNPKGILDVLQNKNFVDHWPFELDTDDKIKYSRKTKTLLAYTRNIQPGDDHDKIAIDFFSDLDFVSGIWISGKLMARKGVPVRFYEFSYDGKINYLKMLFGIKRNGAGHADDHSYIICEDSTKKAHGLDLIIRNTMSQMWTNFAKTSCPTPQDSLNNLVEWPVYTENNPVYLRIDKKIEVHRNYEPQRMAIFEDIYEKYEK
ncbi:PREDICTED: esterase FE4-like [Papilio polytes]|uniref:esterase FE4-like n=1 Tax=Papilio polytes TaxID=76194 RepID=UPI0006765912|nr:PREDICTED: esterase FE4-like [Papilio polytes]